MAKRRKIKLGKTFPSGNPIPMHLQRRFESEILKLSRENKKIRVTLKPFLKRGKRL